MDVKLILVVEIIVYVGRGHIELVSETPYGHTIKTVLLDNQQCSIDYLLLVVLLFFRCSHSRRHKYTSLAVKIFSYLSGTKTVTYIDKLSLIS